MIPGDLQRLHRLSNSVTKPRLASRDSTILSRMFAGTVPPLSPEVMRRRLADNQRWQDDLSFSGTASLTEDRSAVKSAIDEEVSVSGGKRSTATTAYGVISLMGRRREMEDAVTAVPSLTGTGCSHGFFAVYDGNGGFGVAEKRKERLHHLVAEEIGESMLLHEAEARVDWERVMKQSFARMDKEVICGKEVEASGSGDRRKLEGKTIQSTAVVAVVGVEEIVVANYGDSMAVLFQGGVAIPLSRHHKAGIPEERERVEATGESIIDYYDSRNLASSSSTGEHSTRPYVVSDPEVTVYRRTQSHEFLILGSNGLWDAVSSDMACEFVKKLHLHEKCRRMNVCTEREDESYGEGYANHVATMLAEMAISRGSKDNVSVAVLMLC